MFVNPYLYLAVPVSLFCYLAGAWCASRVRRPWGRIILVCGFLLLGVPAVMLIGYYAHLFG